MVFGNLGDSSGVRLAFTRYPNTGVKEFCGDFLKQAQGLDVVAGNSVPGALRVLKRTSR